MRKCSRCKMIFYLDERTRCLYCDTLLMTVESDKPIKGYNYYDAGGFNVGLTIIKQILADRKEEEHGQIAYIVGSYFRSRTFHFMYSFSRAEFLMGKEFKRGLIQPVNMYSVLMLPWVVWDFIDTVSVRLLYNGFCEACGWKFKQVSKGAVHDLRDCEYCKEYSAIIHDILNGDITRTEREHKERAEVKENIGKKSAYQDLCSSKKFMSGIVDIACIWFSICLIVFAVSILVFPPMAVWVHNLE